MFERFTEKARRVIFFARYEASQYGSKYIDTEYVLLGLFREDKKLICGFLGFNVDIEKVRSEVERSITKRERISTSVEVPLSTESKQILLHASQQAGEMGHRHIGPEHLLLGTLLVENSLAARILTGMGLKAPTLRERISKSASFASFNAEQQANEEAMTVLNGFLANLKANNWADSVKYLAALVQFIDYTGRRWVGRDEIERKFADLFVPYAKRDVTFRVESAGSFGFGPANCATANILWENVLVPGRNTREMHRMFALLGKQDDEWVIFLLQVTPVLVP